MPIKPENKGRYPDNWPEIRQAILTRAGDRCEFLDDNGKRCTARNYFPHPLTGSKVVLTIAHLNHEPEDNRPKNLKAGCQLCHNRYDAEHRAETRKATREAASKQTTLF